MPQLNNGWRFSGCNLRDGDVWIVSWLFFAFSSPAGLIECVLSKPRPGCFLSYGGDSVAEADEFHFCWKTFNTWVQGDLGYRGWYVSSAKVHLCLCLTVWPYAGCTPDTGCSLVTSKTKQTTNCIAICQWVPFSPDDNHSGGVAWRRLMDCIHLRRLLGQRNLGVGDIFCDISILRLFYGLRKALFYCFFVFRKISFRYFSLSKKRMSKMLKFPA